MRTENQNIKIKCPKIEKLHLQKKKIHSAQNMNKMKKEKYGLSPEEINKRSLSGE